MTAQILAALLSASPYVMHEWGTFTSVAGEDGVALQWRPLEGKSDLPSFVHTMERYGEGIRHGPRGKGDVRASVRMETPVIYFYPREEMTVEASVRFPNGLVTEWYPMARSWAGPNIDWGKLKLVPGSKAALPKESAPSHYYPAREVDAAVVESCGKDGRLERDRFIFYRGVGTFELPMKVRLDGANVAVSGARGVTLVFERRGDLLGFTAVPSGADVKLARPALTASAADARAALERALIGTGLYEKEAKAMLATWNDTWFEEGVRVFSLLGTEDVNRLLPLTLNPAPSESVRVLVARIELFTPERQAAFAKAVLTAPKPALAREGRFAEPLLTLALAKASGADKAKLQAVLETISGRAGTTAAW